MKQIIPIHPLLTNFKKIKIGQLQILIQSGFVIQRWEYSMQNNCQMKAGELRFVIKSDTSQVTDSFLEK